MTLFTAHLKALRGFYASDVYVVAENREQALERALAALETYFDGQVQEFGVSFLIRDSDNMPDDPEFSQNRADWLEEIKGELEQMLVPASDVIINVRI